MSFVSLDLLVLGRHEPARLFGMAELARRQGYTRLWVADERFFRDCWVQLGAVAARIPDLGLGVCVTDPYVRHPALTAVAAASVDELCGGRFTLGLGAGVSGFTAMGIERERPLTAMRETIAMVRALLRGERLDVDGDHVSFRDASLDVPPRPDLPIMVATNGPRMLELAGTLADEVMVQGLASATMVESVRRHVPDEVRLTARIDVCISDDDPAAARAAVRPGLVRHLATHHPHYASFRLAGVEVPPDLSDRVAELGYGHDVGSLADDIPDEWIDTFCLAGSTDHVAARLSTLAATGIDAVTVMPVPLEGTPIETTVSRVATLASTL